MIWLLIIVFAAGMEMRYKPRFTINDDGDILFWYWSYYYPWYLGYDPNDGFKIRKSIKLFNIVS